MKFLSAFNFYFWREMFAERFCFFDLWMLIVFIELSRTYNSLWWLLGIIPATLISAVMTTRFYKTNNRQDS